MDGEIHGLPGILSKLQGKNGVEATISNSQDFILKWANMPKVAVQEEEESKEPLTDPYSAIADAMLNQDPKS